MRPLPIGDVIPRTYKQAMPDGIEVVDSEVYQIYFKSPRMRRSAKAFAFTTLEKAKDYIEIVTERFVETFGKNPEIQYKIKKVKHQELRRAK